jgi:hypothetical protein
MPLTFTMGRRGRRKHDRPERLSTPARNHRSRMRQVRLVFLGRSAGPAITIWAVCLPYLRDWPTANYEGQAVTDSKLAVTMIVIVAACAAAFFALISYLTP